jgi:hypothetical protein
MEAEFALLSLAVLVVAGMAQTTGSPVGSGRGRCRHRGEEVRREPCRTCCGVVQLKVFACVVHGECTVGKALPGVACCATCADHEPQPGASRP